MKYHTKVSYQSIIMKTSLNLLVSALNSIQRLTRGRLIMPGGGGLHSMLRVRVCAAHLGGFFGPKFSKQGSPFRQIFRKTWVGFQEIGKKLSKTGSLPQKFMIKVGMTATVGN